MEEEFGGKPLIIFGRDVTQIPCFRNSFLYGISGGVVGGLATFMFTSKPRIASHMSVASFVGVTWTYWMYCRFNWSQQRKEAAQLQALIEQRATYDGTLIDKKIEGNKQPLPLVEV